MLVRMKLSVATVSSELCNSNQRSKEINISQHLLHQEESQNKKKTYNPQYFKHLHSKQWQANSGTILSNHNKLKRMQIVAKFLQKQLKYCILGEIRTFHIRTLF